MPKIEIAHEPALDAAGAAGRHAVRVQARSTDGHAYSETVEQRRGSARFPLTQDAIEHKFARVAGSVISPGRAEELQSVVMVLEQQQEVRRLSELLAGT